MKRALPSIWDTPGLMDALRELAGMREHSAAVISRILSKQFKLPITRNAVIGRMHRSKLRGGFGKQRPGTNPKRTAPVFKADPNEPTPRGDVPCGCRWMHGPASDRNFCGAPTVRFGISWCHHHCARVWNPATPAQVAKFAKFVTWRAA